LTFALAKTIPKNMFRRYILPWVGFIIYRLLSWSWRVRCIEAEGLKRARAAGEPLIFAHWHGDELMIFPLVKEYKIATMTSTSKDGELADFAIRMMGAATSRGSSTRGAIGALKGLIRLMGQGYNASMAVDGPKGPIYKVKPGVFELSRLAKAKIVPMGAAPANAIEFRKSWNKARLPKPFSRVVVWFNEPLETVTKDQSPHDPALIQRLEAEIAKACQSATQALP
jgi:lysophospholipid acyltransferase (LPLAT)-like uncharacterized protein